MRPAWSRRLLQLVVVVLGLVPVLAGLDGVVRGVGMAEPGLVPDAGSAPGSGDAVALDSHVRYLSGLLLGLGLAFWSMVPRIERHAARFRLLGAMVVLGGLGRLLGVALRGSPPPPMLLALAVELVVTPLLCWWQARIADRA